jgi:cold-inducible RNA-binding protein
MPPAIHRSGSFLINIFVRNLNPTTTEAELQELFAVYGAVDSVTLVKDRDTDGARGMAFVEMQDEAQANAAIASLNGFLLNEHEMQLNEAREKKEHDSVRDAFREHRRHKI